MASKWTRGSVCVAAGALAAAWVTGCGGEHPPASRTKATDAQFMATPIPLSHLRTTFRKSGLTLHTLFPATKGDVVYVAWPRYGSTCPDFEIAYVTLFHNALTAAGLRLPPSRQMRPYRVQNVIVQVHTDNPRRCQLPALKALDRLREG